jgi:hypothetical protein
MKKRGVFVFVVCMGFMASPFAGIRPAEAAASAPATPLVCSGGGAKASYLAAARKSPLYALLKSKLGEPTGCEYEESELLVKFAQGGTLTINAGPKIEYSQEEATFPTSGATVSRDEAVVALKNVEKATGAYPGLGVDWTQFEGPIPSGSVLKEVDGNDCNFKVHIHMDKGVVVAIGDSMAC